MRILKRKPVLLSKLKGENKEILKESEVTHISMPAASIFDDNVPNCKKSKKRRNLSTEEDSVIFHIAQGFFGFLKALFTKYIFVLIILYILLRWVGIDIYPPFGDFVTNIFKKASLFIQNYFRG